MACTAAVATIGATIAYFLGFSPKRSSKSFSCLCDTGAKWFAEVSDEMWPGQAFCLAIAKTVFRGKSEFQDISILESTTYGTVLILDGVIQATTRDEHAYQETLAHTPMHLVKEAKRALVIGGGDGGILRELAKYPELEEIHICELDSMVIETCRKYLPQTACGFDDPRVTIHIEDGFTFLARNAKEENFFDVIVSDLSDPVGPAQAIFTENFLELVSLAMTPNGAAVMQGESMWLHIPLINKLVSGGKKIFKDCKYASMSIPSYPGGQIGALVYTKDAKVKVDKPVRVVSKDLKARLRYYSTDLHSAQFVLPAEISRQIYE
jgi:spermidine synthase